MTKYSDFRLIDIIGRSELDWRFKAIVTEKSGFIFKKTVSRQITKTYAGSWVFSDSGKWAPSEIDDLCRMLESQQMRNLQDIKFNPS